MNEGVVQKTIFHVDNLYGNGWLRDTSWTWTSTRLPGTKVQVPAAFCSPFTCKRGRWGASRASGHLRMGFLFTEGFSWPITCSYRCIHIDVWGYAWINWWNDARAERQSVTKHVGGWCLSQNSIKRRGENPSQKYSLLYLVASWDHTCMVGLVVSAATNVSWGGR